MIPVMPAYVALPSQYRDAYQVAAVVAAIPLGHGTMYAVTAVSPETTPSTPAFVAAEVERGRNGSWYADETTEPGPLRNALASMCDLAGRPGCPSGL